MVKYIKASHEYTTDWVDNYRENTDTIINQLYKALIKYDRDKAISILMRNGYGDTTLRIYFGVKQAEIDRLRG